MVKSELQLVKTVGEHIEQQSLQEDSLKSTPLHSCPLVTIALVRFLSNEIHSSCQESTTKCSALITDKIHVDFAGWYGTAALRPCQQVSIMRNVMSFFHQRAPVGTCWLDEPPMGISFSTNLSHVENSEQKGFCATEKRFKASIYQYFPFVRVV